ARHRSAREHHGRLGPRGLAEALPRLRALAAPGLGGRTMRSRRWTAFLWILTGGVALLLLLKFFVADVYRVDSGSMRPTIFGGRDRADGEEDAEHVLVLYGKGFEPQRFDLVVVASPDGSKPLVKRVCGLPGDRDFVIRDGDLFVGRARLPSDV